MDTTKTTAHSINFVINKSMDEGKWYAKVGKNEVDEKAIIFFQKKELSLGMKIALLAGTVKKGEEIAKKYLKELDLPVASVSCGVDQRILERRFNEIEKQFTDQNSFTNERQIAGAAMNVNIKITVKTKEYETKKTKFCDDLYNTFDAKSQSSESEKKRKLADYGYAFDYLHGLENKDKQFELRNTLIMVSFALDNHKKSGNGKHSTLEHETTIKKIIEKYESNTRETIGRGSSSNLKNNLEKNLEEKSGRKTVAENLDDLKNPNDLKIALNNLKNYS